MMEDSMSMQMKTSVASEEDELWKYLMLSVNQVVSNNYFELKYAMIEKESSQRRDIDCTEN